MTLDKAKRGQRVLIKNIDDAAIRIQAIRLGIYEGAEVDCSAKIPFGPIIVSNRLQEVAIGRNLARKILIEINDVREGA